MSFDQFLAQSGIDTITIADDVEIAALVKGGLQVSDHGKRMTNIRSTLFSAAMGKCIVGARNIRDKLIIEYDRQPYRSGTLDRSFLCVFEIHHYF